MQTKLSHIKMTAICFLSSIFLISCQNQPLTENNKYDGYVAIEKVAKYMTQNEKDQKMLTSFLYNFEEVFHIDPHVLFQNSNYLTATIHKFERFESLKLYFTDQEPKIQDGFLRFNGYLSYKYVHSNYDKYTRFESWYQGPSKHSDWTFGIITDLDVLKIVDLRKFDWHQDPKNP